MVVDENLYIVLRKRLADSETVDIIRRGLAQGVVLDTWMNGEEEEQVSEEAEAALEKAAEDFAERAVQAKAVLPNYQMPDKYVYSVFHELLFSSALYAAQKKKGYREVGLPEAEEAIEGLTRFVTSEPEGLTAAGIFFITITIHEDLNAIAYYRLMKKDDFILGTLHRPWSNMVLNVQLELYRKMGLTEVIYTAEGDMLALTDRGEEALEGLRRILRNSGELKWRSENQRWVIFAETDYDMVFNCIFPNGNQLTGEYLRSIGLKRGMRVLEVGAGTGRATIDLGLCDLVGPEGKVVALEPSAALLQKLEAKCLEHGITNVEVVQGKAEALSFPDGSFDAAIAVISLHFTDVAKAVAEMVRVTKPGGLISALCPPPEFDVREIPMVALWFRPLSEIAERLGVPFSERNGLPAGLLNEAFCKNAEAVLMTKLPVIVSAENHANFLAFMLKGAAFFQNIFCRLPYRERWGIMGRLEEEGASLAAATSPEEKKHVFFCEAAFGKAPESGQRLPT